MAKCRNAGVFFLFGGDVVPTGKSNYWEGTVMDKDPAGNA